MIPTFESIFVRVFAAEHPRVYRLLDRLSGEPDLAADIAQDVMIRLYRRGSLPDNTSAWLVAVAMNLLRSRMKTASRRRALLTVDRAAASIGDPPPLPGHKLEAERSPRVRAALDSLAERERVLLLMCAEGFSYAEMARVAGMKESSVGTTLARAKRAFREHYEGDPDAS
jgi:RNA polymerase sigma factor (sigma-70 family)